MRAHFRTPLARFPESALARERYHHDKIRIAYISADFRDHATSWLAAGLFEHHDKSRFETVAVSLLADDGSEMRRAQDGF